jgi:hypothetical protein
MNFCIHGREHKRNKQYTEARFNKVRGTGVADPDSRNG